MNRARAKPERKQMNRWISITAAFLIAATLVLLLKVGPSSGGVDHFRSVLVSYGPWAIIISAALMIGQAIIAPLPANVITITNALVFGPFWGALLSWMTTLIGASLCFYLSQTFGKPFAAKIVGKSVERAEAFFAKYGLPAMFVVRIVPFIPFDAISYVAGLVGVPYSKFVLATAIGIIPSIFAYSYLGSIFAGAYWWILFTMLGVSLVAVLVALLCLKKSPDTAFVAE
jgi:uncharacterized membrane protein YdjX (TVP38/TMEM64 family)